MKENEIITRLKILRLIFLNKIKRFGFKYENS